MEKTKKKKVFFGGDKKRRIIYSSNKPKFTISADRFQWILEAKSQPTCYFPTLSLLLDELAEQYFRKMPKKLKTLADLDKRISWVYEMIERVSKGFHEFP
jgi:hypothetical protein